MNRSPLALFVGLAAMTVSVWASDPASELIGYWELVEQDYGLRIEFLDNGAYVALTNRGLMTGRWEQLDESHLATWNRKGLPRRVSEFTIDGDILIITDENGGGAQTSSHAPQRALRVRGQLTSARPERTGTSLAQGCANEIDDVCRRFREE